MTHGSLFSGIGGFDLAAEWAGWENVFHCEWNEFGQKVLKYHFPQSISYNDITKTDFTIHKGQIDVLTGGFPCQPYSSAGKRLGTADNRHLWPEMLRAIREIQPRWIVGENVRGLTNWNGGMVFDEVQLNLEVEGYEVIPFLLPACAVNAPHRRDRIWFIAYSTSSTNGANKFREVRQSNEKANKERTQTFHNAIRSNGVEGFTSNTNSNGLHQRNSNNEINASEKRINAFSNINKSINNGNASNTENIRQKYALENGELEGRRFRKLYKRNVWDSFPSVSAICGGNDGISKELDNITFSKWRQESLKAYGNAIVPQVAYQIFNSINEYEKGH
jgi:DNA (cytosine-5)-methyltransferase 1